MSAPQPYQYIGEPWEYQPALENDAQFAQFCNYRDLPRAGRTIPLLLEVMGYAENGGSHLYALRRSARWDERARLWDAEIDRRALDALAATKAEQYNDQLTMVNAMSAKAVRAIQKLDPDKLTPAQLLKFMEFITDFRLRTFGPLVHPDEAPAPEQHDSGDRRTFEVITPEPRKK